MTTDYIVRLIDLPDKIPALVARDSDGFYNIYINARMNAERQQVAFAHEMSHLANNHFDKTQNIMECERIADAESKATRKWARNSTKD